MRLARRHRAEWSTGRSDRWDVLPEPGDNSALDQEPWTWRLEASRALHHACRADGSAPVGPEPALRGIEGLLQSVAP